MFSESGQVQALLAADIVAPEVSQQKLNNIIFYLINSVIRDKRKLWQPDWAFWQNISVTVVTFSTFRIPHSASPHIHVNPSPVGFIPDKIDGDRAYSHFKVSNVAVASLLVWNISYKWVLPVHSALKLREILAHLLRAVSNTCIS